MKIRKALMNGLAVSAVLLAANAFSAEIKGMPGVTEAPVSAKPAAKQIMGKGVVTAADTQKGVVTIAHDPIKDLSWPAMTMGFKVGDSALLKKAEVGKKIDFVLEDRGGPTIVAIK